MKTSVSVIAGGDSFMTRFLPEEGYEGLAQLRELICSHDVRFNNLEFTAQDMEGPPSAFSGGTWAMAPSDILDDLDAFGFNLYNTANNHAMDYCQQGLLATARHLRERGMKFAGTGENLARAAAPAYVECAGGRVAMIGVVSTFHDSDAAGPQGAQLPGRPGLNPLRFTAIHCVEKKYFDELQEIADKTCMNNLALFALKNGFASAPPEGILYFNGLLFKQAPVNMTVTAPNKQDLARTLEGIRDAKRQADLVLVSVHSHDFAGMDNTRPAQYVETFAHACIDAGADAILGHGPHELRGIEIYKGKPIFYSLGNFLFQSDTVECQPKEAFEKAGLADDTLVGAYMDRRSNGDTTGYAVDKNIWRSVLASFTMDGGRLTDVTLHPISLHQELPRSRRGLPTLSRDEDTLRHLAELSQRYHTEIEIQNGTGHIRLDAPEI